MSDDSTASLVDPPPPQADRRGEPSLVLVMNAARPLEPPMRIGIAGIDEIELGRGPDLQVVPTGPRRLRVDLPDRAVSQIHARIVRTPAGWTVTDDRSHNGTLIDGERVETAELGRDAVCELGNCFLVIRDRAVTDVGGPPGCRTLSGELAHELELARRVASSNLPILVVGETGTGKELVARAAHELSKRRGLFVAVNCGAIPASLVESELFGVRRGAYSGAADDRLGTVTAADKGTLFLDEIAELPEPSQAALLRVLQEGEVKPLGAATAIRVDVRVLAATHRNLPELVAQGKFRDDLYARLRAHVVHLPPLRSRREDLGLVVAELLNRSAGPRAPSIALQRAAARTLFRHRWPHNIRELEQVLRRALSLAGGNEIGIEHLPDELTGSPARAAAPEHDDRTHLVELLRKHRGNLSAVARELATSRSQVERLLARHGLDDEEFRPRRG